LKEIVYNLAPLPSLDEDLNLDIGLHYYSGGAEGVEWLEGGNVNIIGVSELPGIPQLLALLFGG